MAENFHDNNAIESAAQWVSDHKIETAIGLVALAGVGGVVGRKVLQNVAAREFAPTVAMDVAEGVTARGVGKGVLFAMEDGTSVLARKGTVQLATPEVAGTLRMGRDFEIALADGTKIKTGGLLQREETIRTSIPGLPTQTSYMHDFNVPKLQELTTRGVSIRPSSVSFPGGELQARSISGPGDPANVLSGKFGPAAIENAGGNQFTLGNITFSPESYRVGGWNGPVRRYSSLLRDLSH